MGLQFGLWFEPEMVSPISELYKEHPDCVFTFQEEIGLKLEDN